MTIYVISLGCPRNLVEGEALLGEAAQAGFTPVPDPEKARVILVHTCGFVRDAVDESIDAILELARYKQDGCCETLAVTGCLVQRYGKDLAEEIPEVDFFLGTGELSRLVSMLKKPSAGPMCCLSDPSKGIYPPQSAPRILSTGPLAYVKISEGCPESCTFCIIPKLKGRLRSRLEKDILDEITGLSGMGPKEIVLVAQETTAYGMDQGETDALARLLGMAARGFPRTWFRTLYTHPNRVTPALMDVVAQHANLCPYFDVPIQHASDPVLKRMGRRYGKEDLERLFSQIRERVPQAVLRTTILVGFPGETHRDFTDLLEFLEKTRFDHLGVFTYSDAEDLASHRLSGHVDPALAQDRLGEVMELQAGISEEILSRSKGKTVPVLVTGPSEEPEYPWEGRTMGQAPDIDGKTFIRSGDLKAGDLVDVRVLETGTYDLFGETS